MQKIYLLPGLMTDERLWSRVIPLLKEFEFIHIPIPMVEDFDKACDELDKIFSEEKSVNLLGFSLGSYLASFYAIRNPKKINKLFLLAGSASFIDESEVKKRKIYLEQIDRFGFKGLSSKKVLSLIEEENYNDTDLVNIIKDMYSKLGLEVFKTQMQLSFKRVDISEDLTALKIPIRVFYSTNDRLFNYESLANIKSKSCENIVFSKREGKSHMISLEDPKRLAKEIKKWMLKG